MQRSIFVATCLSLFTMLPSSAVQNPEIYLAECGSSSATIISVPPANGFGVGGGKNFIKLNNESGKVSCGIVCDPNPNTLPTGASAIVMEVIEPVGNISGNYMTVEACTDLGFASVNIQRVGRGGQRVAYEIKSSVKINAFTVYLTKACTAEIGGIAVVGLPSNASTAASAKAQTTNSSNGLDFALLPPEINAAQLYSGAGQQAQLAAAAAWAALAQELEQAAAQYQKTLPAGSTPSPLSEIERKLSRVQALQATAAALAMDDALKSISTTPISCKNLHLECID